MTTAPRVGSVQSAGNPPVPEKGATPSDTYFGTVVNDPFRALEDSDAATTKAWEADQSQKFAAYLAAGPDRLQFQKDAKALLDAGTLSLPTQTVQGARKRYFYTERGPGMKQPVLYVTEGLKGKPRALLDITREGSGTAALDWNYPSPRGNFLAWGISEGGNEQSVLHLRDVATGKDTGEIIDRARHTELAWLPDESAFVYTRLPAPGTVPAGEENMHSALFLHKRGTGADKDALLYTPKDKTWFAVPAISPNGKWLVVTVNRGWASSDVYVAAMSEPSKFTVVREDKPFQYTVTAEDDGMYVLTTEGAPRGKVIFVHYQGYVMPLKGLRDHVPETLLFNEANCAVQYDCRLESVVISETAGVLSQFVVGEHGIALQYSINSGSEVLFVTYRDHLVRSLVHGGTLSLSGTRDRTEFFVHEAGFRTSGKVRRFVPPLGAGADMPLGTDWRVLSVPSSVSGLVAEHYEAISKDGTKVIYYVLRAKSLTGPAPGILYGYGGFNIAVTPNYSPRALMAATHGMVWVQAVLRGGSEFGEAWHQAGMKTHKQNVFDDYLAVAKDLVKRKLVAPGHLAAMGGSNGGLLVSAAITQRPDLFRAGVSMVPLTDMIRFPLFRLGKLWVSEYGDIAKVDEFRALYAYSPYHNVHSGTAYPAMLYTTAPNDTRVDPMHARKMVAALQSANAGREGAHPVLLRIDQEAGHGAGKPTDKLAAEYADIYAFLLRELGALPYSAPGQMPGAIPVSTLGFAKP